MLSLRTLARISGSVAVIGIVGAVSSPGQAAAPAFDVIVDNPVSLNPATANPVTIVNPPGAPPSTVTVANPVSAASIAKAQGIQTPAAFSLSAGGGVTLPFPGDFHVPSSQRLILEYVSGRCGVINGAVDEIGVAIQQGAASFQKHLFNLNSVRSASVAQGIFGHTVKIYAAPGSVVSLNGDFTFAGSGLSEVSCDANFSGQLVDVP